MQPSSIKEVSALLNFLYELPNDYTNYPDHVLELIDRYFPFHKLTFIPLNSSFATLNSSNPDTWFNEIRTRGLSEQLLEQYYTRAVELDPFRARNLPAQLRFRPVIQVEEAFPEKNSRCARYHSFLRDANVPYQTILNLVYDKVRLGVISIYRSEEEGPLSRDEIWILEELSRFIAQHYMIAISQTSRHLAEELFNSCYQNVDFGAMILDNKRDVVQANDCAQKYCDIIYNALFRECDPLSDESASENLHTVQYVMTQFQERLVTDNEHITIPIDNALFEFRINSFISIDENFSKISLNYLLFIFQSSYISESEKLGYSRIRQKLTDREWEIAKLISQGLTNAKIAEQTFISLNTVKTHIQHIYEKLNVQNRVSLMQLLSEESKSQY